MVRGAEDVVRHVKVGAGVLVVLAAAAPEAQRRVAQLAVGQDDPGVQRRASGRDGVSTRERDTTKCSGPRPTLTRSPPLRPPPALPATRRNPGTYTAGRRSALHWTNGSVRTRHAAQGASSTAWRARTAACAAAERSQSCSGCSSCTSAKTSTAVVAAASSASRVSARRRISTDIAPGGGEARRAGGRASGQGLEARRRGKSPGTWPPGGT